MQDFCYEFVGAGVRFVLFAEAGRYSPNKFSLGANDIPRKYRPNALAGTFPFFALNLFVRVILKSSLLQRGGRGVALGEEGGCTCQSH